MPSQGGGRNTGFIAQEEWCIGGRGRVEKEEGWEEKMLVEGKGASGDVSGAGCSPRVAPALIKIIMQV